VTFWVLERKHVARYAWESGVREGVAERDIVLTYVLRILSDSILSRLAFKGGTCLKKTYLGKNGRFSTDLDFTSAGISLNNTMSKVRRSLHNKTHFDMLFKVVDENKRSESYLAIVNYSHDWNAGSQFKLEVSFREKPILPTVNLPLSEERYFRYCEFQTFRVRSMQKEELLAEKIRASYQRIRSQDLYDLYLLADAPYDRGLVKRLAIVKCWNARDPFNPHLFFDRIENAEYNWKDLKILVRKEMLPSEEVLIETVLDKYKFLGQLDGQLLKVIKDSQGHKEIGLVRNLVSNLRKRSARS